MKRLNWLAGLRTTLSWTPVRTMKVPRGRARDTRLLAFQPLEDRRVLAVDFGDAPDTSLGAGVGNYNTRATDNGAQHTIVVGLRMGANVDGDGGALQNAAANADDVNGALPDDEDGLVNPAADLTLTVGAQPTVNVRVTNTTSSVATLYGWIDYDGNGAFSNATERAVFTLPFPPFTVNNAVVTLTFPTVPVGAAHTTYARFRLSTDSAAAFPTGAAANGEVEDYRVTIVSPSANSVDSSKTEKIAHNTNGGPPLDEGDFFGSAVASLGDLDGDGVTDLAVGAQSRDAAGGNGGAVHILFMNANGTVKSRQKIAGGLGGGPSLTLGDYFGRSLANLGDLDGDGVVDLAVGADRDDTGGSLRGAVYVLFLNSNGTVKNSQKIAHNTGGGPALANVDRFGTAVANLGDLDGDGIVDMAVGANSDSTGGTLRGAAYVLFMNANGTVKAQQKIASGVGNPDNGFFGSSLAGLGDLDGDGITELAVGVPGDATGGYGRGAVQVLMLNANGTVKASRKIANGVGGGPILADSDFFGTATASAGDLDGDGVTDLVVGARYDDGGGSNRGAIYMLRLNPDGTAKNVQKIGDNTGGGPVLADADLFGRSATSLGDLDGDGRTDFAVGAERDDTGGPVGSNRGAVYVLFSGVLNTNPVFTSPATANVAENNTGIMTVTATDAEAPPQTVTFSIVGGVDQSRFSITSGGFLSFTSPPNFEAPGDANGDNVYVVTVQARDGQGGMATQTISVTVTPVNESNPVFTSTASASVAENTAFVKTVTATDADLPAQAVTFSIVGGVDQTRFSLTSGGALSFVAAPNFEAPSDANGDNVYVVTVQASDGLGRTTSQTIAVTVTPVNESGPVFTTPNTVSVPENLTSVMTVAATDADRPSQPITFSIAAIGAHYAQSQTHNNDVFSPNVLSYSFTAVPPPSGDATLTLTAIADLDASTEFLTLNAEGLFSQNFFVTGGQQQALVNATATIPQAVLQQLAADGVISITVTPSTDVGNLGTNSLTLDLNYAIGFDQTKFSITPGGVLSFVTPPNYEAPTDANGDNVYVVTVQASDGAGGTTTQTINVAVTPVNDNNPVFTSAPTANVEENSTAVTTLTATDADLPAQAISFAIVGGADQARFQLTSGGQFSFVAAPDFEAPADANGDNVYLVTVQASDGQGRISNQTLSVTVTPVNENQPMFTSTASASVVENTTFVKVVTATDSDLPAHAVTFSIVGGVDRARFSITPGGALSFVSPPIFEAPTDANGDNVYVVTVQANDGMGGAATQTIAVNVIAVNNNSPVFTSPNAVNVAESTTEVLTVTATDADLPAQTLTFSIVGGGDAARFSLSPSGILTFTQPPDFEVPADVNGNNVYTVTVQANDGAGGLALQTINVTVTPVNDNNPVFTSPANVVVPTNTTAVVTVTATDADIPAQAVTFAIVGGADAAKFGLTPGGALSFLVPPSATNPGDANGDNIYVVAVQASDGVGGLSTQTINVTVTPLAIDYGDAPDSALGASAGNYQTLASDNGPGHTIVDGLRLGASVDGDSGSVQNAAASGDDTSGFPPDDEDGVVYPAADLAVTAGAQPTVSLRVTNTTGGSATLYGWIDYNKNGIFENSAERASAIVPAGVTGGIVTLTFPTAPAGSAGTTYARFRLSADPAAANPTGAATGGEVEDYRASMVTPSASVAAPSKTQKIAHNIGGGPVLADEDRFGSAVAALGDLDGDGVVDVAVGAQGHEPIGMGAVYILFMNSDGTVKSQQKIASNVGGMTTLPPGDYFGRSIANLGDLDGDGIVDLAVGADRDSTTGMFRGAVYVLFLNANGTVKAQQKIAHNAGGGPALADFDRFGSAVATLGDLDGDGVVDLAAGASDDHVVGNSLGAVYVLFMNPDGTAKSRQKIASGVGGGPAIGDLDHFGSALAGLGDLDGDGTTELAVGAPGDDGGGDNRGAVHILFLNANGTVKDVRKIADGVGGGPLLDNADSFGSSAARAGDIDGDGVTDLLVGARYDDGQVGALYVLLMSADGTAKSVQKIGDNTGGGPALAFRDLFGRAAAALGDLDGDGRIELAVGAERDDTGGGEYSNRGAVYIMSLAPNGDYNGDAAVNGNDFLAWQRSLGAAVPSGSGADGNRSGVVERGDLLVWSANFGTGGDTPTNSQIEVASAVASPGEGVAALDAASSLLSIASRASELLPQPPHSVNASRTAVRPHVRDAIEAPRTARAVSHDIALTAWSRFSWEGDLNAHPTDLHCDLQSSFDEVIDELRRQL